MKLTWITVLFLVLNSCSTNESKKNENNFKSDSSILDLDISKDSTSKISLDFSRNKTCIVIKNFETFTSLFESTSFPIFIDSLFCQNFIDDSLKRLKQLEELRLPEINDRYNIYALYAFKKAIINEKNDILAIVVSKLAPEKRSQGSNNRSQIDVFVLAMSQSGEVFICKKVFNWYGEFDYFEQSWGKINSNFSIEKRIFKSYSIPDSNEEKKIYKDTIEKINVP